MNARKGKSSLRVENLDWRLWKRLWRDMHGAIERRETKQHCSLERQDLISFSKRNEN